MAETRVRLIPEEIRPSHRLGRHVEHDPRSREFGVRALAPVESIAWHRHVGIFNQESLGSCTGEAMTGALSTEPFTHHFHQKKAVELYHEATELDSIPGAYPPDDTGSTGIAVAKAALQDGYISRYEHAFSLDESLSALMNGPVITGINWYTDMDQPDANGLVRVGGTIRGGHEVCVVAVDVDEKTIRFANSWGTEWGDRGYGLLSWDDWERLLHEEGDVTVPVLPDATTK